MKNMGLFKNINITVDNKDHKSVAFDLDGSRDAFDIVTNKHGSWAIDRPLTNSMATKVMGIYGWRGFISPHEYLKFFNNLKKHTSKPTGRTTQESYEKLEDNETTYFVKNICLLCNTPHLHKKFNVYPATKERMDTIIYEKHFDHIRNYRPYLFHDSTSAQAFADKLNRTIEEG